MTIKKEFKSELESLHKSLIEVNDWMYENPELAFEEFETSKYLVNYIKKYDPQVAHPTYGLDTAFEVTFGITFEKFNEEFKEFLKLPIDEQLKILYFP